MVPYTLEYNKFRFPICNLLYEQHICYLYDY